MCALVLSLSPLERHVGRWLFAGVGVFGVATVVFGLYITPLKAWADRSLDVFRSSTGS